MQKVVVLFCSKNFNGKTAKLLKFHLKKLRENSAVEFYVEFYNVYDFKILPCDGCGFCFSNYGCVKNSVDDFLKLINFVHSADLFILASNVFFSGLPAQLKAFIDRCEQFYLKKKLKNNLLKAKFKEGHLVLTGGNLDKRSFSVILKCVNQFFWCLDLKLKRTIVSPKTDSSGLFFLVK